MKILVTGGAGFIGSALIRYLIQCTDHSVVNLDKLTYAGNLESLQDVAGSDRYAFERADVCDREAVEKVFTGHRPDAVMHLAAESHVDRSIDGPAEFIHTNVVGTYTMLDVARAWHSSNPDFRFLHVSTDEVYGSLGADGLFTEDMAYEPNSPYSASKAASDHLARAWHQTYGLPVVTSNCSNNYGPYQFPEKLIPLVILNGLAGKALPVYGKGDNIRDWLYVDDHAVALLEILTRGTPGETYNVGGHNEMTNIEVVRGICALLDEFRPRSDGSRHDRLIQFVADRPGHDQRYAIDAGKVDRALGWRPKETFDTGLRKTVQWYLDNHAWCQHVQDGSYRGERLGLGAS